METMAERLKRAIALRGMTPADLIRESKISKAGVYFLLDGTTTAAKVRADTVAKVCSVLRISRDWLLKGRGEMEAAAESVDTGWPDIPAYPQAIGLGDGKEAQEYQETHKLKFRRDSLTRKRLQLGSLRVVYGSGDSMLPRIRSGDAIMFDESDRKPVDEKLFVVQAHGMNGPEYSAKRCRHFGDDVYFDSLNPEGDHNWRKPRKMDDKKKPITIVGRVRWIGSWED